MISKVISKIIDSELNRVGVSNYIRLLHEHDEDHILDIRVESFHKNSALEFNLTEENYHDIFVITYNNMKMIPIHVHLDKYDIDINQKNSAYDKESRMNKDMEIKEETIKMSPPTFRGVPIDLSDVNINMDQHKFKISRNDIDPAYISYHHRGRIFPIQETMLLQRHPSHPFQYMMMMMIILFRIHNSLYLLLRNQLLQGLL